MSEKNNFQRLYDIDVRAKTKQKNGLNYLSWSAAWAEVKKLFPMASYTVYENAENRPWFTDEKSGWVKTGVIIEELEHIEYLPIMDFKNKSIPTDAITSMDANKAIQRSLTKACARHGIGLYIYEGEDLPEERKTVSKLQEECMALIKKKSSTESMTKKVGDACKAADEKANGDPRLITEADKLEALKTTLMSIR